MKKNKLNLVIFGLIFIMIATTAISFAYWKDNITGNTNDKDININIGSGEAIETTVDLSDVLISNKSLVPVGRVKDPENETDKIEFTISITWSSQEELFGSDLTNFESHVGLLTVDYTSILLSGEGTELKDVDGLNGRLFKIDFQVYHNISGNETVDVQITITMNEPIDKSQYELIAGKGIMITFNFLIESTFDRD